MKKDTEQKFKTDIEYRLYRLRHFGKKHRWKEVFFKDDIIFFFADEKKLIIDAKEMKILSSLIHPIYGDTFLLRKGDFTQKIIESIFRNPRQHMKKEKVNSEYVK